MDLQQQKQEILFPVSFQLKIICMAHDCDKSAFDRFGKVLDKYSIPYSGWNSKPSSGGKYSSYRVDVTLGDKETMQKMYAELQSLDGVKCVI